LAWRVSEKDLNRKKDTYRMEVRTGWPGASEKGASRRMENAGMAECRWVTAMFEGVFAQIKHWERAE